MNAFRVWLCMRLLVLARRVHPTAGRSEINRYWQVIEVPRRISETEAAEIAAQVRNL